MIEIVDMIIILVLALGSACIAVMQWLTHNRNRSIMWIWICAYWTLQTIKHFIDLFYKQL